MKRILTTMCALAIVMAGAAVPACAAEQPVSDTPQPTAEAQPTPKAETPSKESYYPIDVKEYLEGDSQRISKVYQLALSDDPDPIPTEDFERDGRLGKFHVWRVQYHRGGGVRPHLYVHRNFHADRETSRPRGAVCHSPHS